MFKEFDAAVNAEILKGEEIVSEALLIDLISKTPVDTGLAASSWQLARVKDHHLISNTVPYIDFLNKGTSKQAPAYFVERTALQYGKPIGAIVEYQKS